MKNLKKTTVLALVATLALAGGAAAQVDFSKYYALGDSLTAGVVNYGSVEKYQKQSIPALIAKQAGVFSTFEIPLVSEPGLPPLFQLTALNVTALGISPTIDMHPPGAGSPINATYEGVYNNLGIDGAGTGDLLRLTGNIMNLAADLQKYAQGLVGKKVPFADLVLRDGTTTALQQAIAAQGTFYTVWIGHNELLGAVQSAVYLPGVTVTPIDSFKTDYAQLLGALHQYVPGATIAVGNILDMTNVPFLNAVKPYIVNPADGSHIPLIGEAGPLTENDKVTILAAQYLAQGIGIPVAAGGTGQPLPEGGLDTSSGTFKTGVVLRAGEITAMQEYIAEMNDWIATVAADVGATVLDMHSIWNDLATNGRNFGGVELTTSFLTGGIVGLDGVHGTGLGYAVIANEWIKALNAQLGADLPLVDIKPYLFGTLSATSVSAANFVVGQQAAISLARGYAPVIDTSSLKALYMGRGRTSVRTAPRPTRERVRPGSVRP